MNTTTEPPSVALTPFPLLRLPTELQLTILHTLLTPLLTPFLTSLSEGSLPRDADVYIQSALDVARASPALKPLVRRVLLAHLAVIKAAHEALTQRLHEIVAEPGYGQSTTDVSSVDFISEGFYGAMARSQGSLVVVEMEDAVRRSTGPWGFDEIRWKKGGRAGMGTVPWVGWRGPEWRVREEEGAEDAGRDEVEECGSEESDSDDEFADYRRCGWFEL